MRAGNPRPEEVAALVAALDTALQGPPAPSARTDVPAWARAARREALGHPPVATPGDLRERP